MDLRIGCFLEVRGRNAGCPAPPAQIPASGKSQVDGDGLIRREQAISDYATSHSIEVAGIYREEGISGTKEARVALAEMTLALEQNGHGVDTVIIKKLDRLSRDLMVQESIIRDFRSNGFNLISALEGPDLLSGDPTRKFIHHMFGAIAEYEKDMIVFKLRAARERKHEPRPANAKAENPTRRPRPRLSVRSSAFVGGAKDKNKCPSRWLSKSSTGRVFAPAAERFLPAPTWRRCAQE